MNHQDEKGRFIGHFQKNDNVIWEKSDKDWVIATCLGWCPDYACYGYQIKEKNLSGSFANVPEFALKMKTQ